jgi:26S proteasome regulatory subunit N2
MDLDPSPATIKPAVPASEKMDVDEEKRAKSSDEAKDKKEADNIADKETSTPTDTKKKTEKEKVGFEIENMSRVLPGQLKFISFPAGRYKPVKKVSILARFLISDKEPAS